MYYIHLFINPFSVTTYLALRVTGRQEPIPAIVGQRRDTTWTSCHCEFSRRANTETQPPTLTTTNNLKLLISNFKLFEINQPHMHAWAYAGTGRICKPHRKVDLKSCCEVTVLATAPLCCPYKLYMKEKTVHCIKIDVNIKNKKTIAHVFCVCVHVWLCFSLSLLLCVCEEAH